MTNASAPSPTVQRLALELVGGNAADPFTAELAAWLAGSRRFRGFATAHRDKIRKKLRGASDAEDRRDVRLELRAAHLLLRDRRIDLAFEAFGSGKGGPDFTVTFRRQRAFNIEVTRMRRVPDPAGFAAVVLAKLRQLRPGLPNALLVGVEGAGADAVDVAVVNAALRLRADRKDEAFFADGGFDGARDFYRRYLRLGAVLVLSDRAAGDARATLWINPSSRIAVPEPAARECLACLRGG